VQVVVGRAGHVGELGERPEAAMVRAVQHRALLPAGGQQAVDVLGRDGIRVIEASFVQLGERAGAASGIFHIKDYI
jgi:hypothetical protein